MNKKKGGSVDCDLIETRSRAARWSKALLCPATLMCLFLTGCPGGAELDNAEQIFESAVQDDSGGEACDATRVFVKSCGLGGGCHQSLDDGTPPLGGVDLVAPDVEARLVDVQATFPNYPECAGTPALLIDSENLEESYLWKKVNNTHGECGDGMPTPYFNSSRLSLTDIECLRSWIVGTVTTNPDNPEQTP